MNNSTKRGFTLIELLVVIAIISILSSVVIAATTTARKKAKVAQIVRSLKEAEMAFNLVYDKYGCWPVALVTPPAGSCVSVAHNDEYLSVLITNNSFGLADFLKRAPTYPLDTTKQWLYYNQLVESAPCTDSLRGVQLYVSSVPSSDYELLEKAIDGTPSANLYTNEARYCGKVVFSGNVGEVSDLAYVISQTTK